MILHIRQFTNYVQLFIATWTHFGFKDQLKTDIVDFKAGDTVSVGVRVTEGNRSRIQLFDGVVIAFSFTMIANKGSSPD